MAERLLSRSELTEAAQTIVAELRDRHTRSDDDLLDELLDIRWLLANGAR